MPAMASLDEIRSALRRHRPELVEERPGLSWAAVAAVVRTGPEGAELLFIHRSEHPDDPWSGHMAFPGGRVEGPDAGPYGAVIRETREELSLDLEAEGRLLGRLSDVRAIARGRALPLVIAPFVFELLSKPVLAPNHEVEAVVWVPVRFLADRGNRSTYRWRQGPVAFPLPCYRYQGHLIWGLTFAMVDELVGLLPEEGHTA